MTVERKCIGSCKYPKHFFLSCTLLSPLNNYGYYVFKLLSTYLLFTKCCFLVGSVSLIIIVANSLLPKNKFQIVSVMQYFNIRNKMHPIMDNCQSCFPR